MTTTITRPRRWPLAVVAALAGSMLAAAPAGAAGPFDDRVVIAEGHTDVFYASESDGAAVLQVHDDTVSPHAYRAPEDVVFHVRPSVAQRTASAFVANGIPNFTAVGETVYVLPQNNQQGQIFAGFGHALMPITTAVTYTITDYSGPGNFASWQSGEEGPIVFHNASSLPSSFTSQANHEHLNWGFTELGTYELTVTASFTGSGGTTLTSPEQTYTFHVGEELPEFPETTLSVDGLAESYAVGETVSLSARQDPETGEDHYHWFTQAPGESGWTVVPGALTGAYEFAATADHDGTRIIARLYDHDHHQFAESAPVTVNVAAPPVDPGPGPGPGPGPDPAPIVTPKQPVTIKTVKATRTDKKGRPIVKAGAKGKKSKIRLRITTGTATTYGKAKVRIKGVKGLLNAKVTKTGRLVIKIPARVKPGKRTLIVRYLGNDQTEKTKQNLTIRVRR